MSPAPIHVSKVALMFSSNASEWTSCQVIVPNLIKAYEKLIPKNKLLKCSLSKTMGSGEISDLVQKVKAFQPDEIAFVDHHPHPGSFLQLLKIAYGRHKIPELHFHLFGDFTYFLRDWLRIANLLKGTKVKWICASRRQAKLVSSLMIKEENAGVFNCHFPVDVEYFNYNPKFELGWRKTLGINENDFVILYTGRLSLQKNIISMLKLYFKFALKCKKIPYLLLAGNFDDLGAPFFGVHSTDGYYFQTCQQLLEMFPKNISKKIIFLGGLDSNSLRGIYHESDVFLSLSLHHDEDYGMSPAEALCCGMPVILSDWGGYDSFNWGDDRTVMLDTTIEEDGLEIDKSKALVALNHYYHNPPSKTFRKKLSKEAQDRYSVDALVKLLKSFRREEARSCEGFNWKMRQFSGLLGSNTPFHEGPIKNSFYREIYQYYSTHS